MPVFLDRVELGDTVGQFDDEAASERRVRFKSLGIVGMTREHGGRCHGSRWLDYIG